MIHEIIITMRIGALFSSTATTNKSMPLNPFNCTDVLLLLSSFCDKKTLKALKYVTKECVEHVVIPTEGVSIGYN
jgi:hypothetical protein